MSKVVFYLWNDVFKDYTNDENNAFKTENGLLKFRQFFDSKGDVMLGTLKEFLTNLGLHSTNVEQQTEQSIQKIDMKHEDSH